MLTWQKKNGEWGLNGVPEEELKKVGSRIYAALFKLKDYEQQIGRASCRERV